MAEVTLHVYDVTNSGNVRANTAIMNLNKVMRGGIGLGGIFHGAVEVYGKEWSFGFCETGSGVFSCPPKANPMYTYRESVSLGITAKTSSEVDAIVTALRTKWPGNHYDLLSRNCNHFCDEFCEKLVDQKLPLWVNRFANAGDAAIGAAENTMERLRQAKTQVASVTQNAMRFMFGSGSSSPITAGSGDSLSNSGRRLSMMGSPSRLLSRGSPSSSQNGHSGRHSRQSSESTEQRPILLPWKEPALSSSSLDSKSSSKSSQSPVDSPSH